MQALSQRTLNRITKQGKWDGGHLTTNRQAGNDRWSTLGTIALVLALNDSRAAMNVVATILGVIVVVLTVVDVVFTMVLPRRPSGIEQISLLVNRSVRMSFERLSHLAKTYERQDAILAPTGPVALVLQLLLWAALLVLGFALILVGAGFSFSDGFLQALTALFTVGAVHAGGPADSGVDISVGAIWVVIVALQIAYLPALYSSFNRREGLVSLLESRAGVPAWGPELLARHQLVGISDTLPDLYAGVGGVGGRRRRNPHHLPRTPPLSVPRAVVLVAPRPPAPSSTPPPCTWRSRPVKRLPRPACVFAWDSHCSTGSQPHSVGRWTSTRIPMGPSI